MQGAEKGRKQQALPSYLQRRRRRLPPSAQTAQAGGRRESRLHSIAAGAGYDVLTASAGFEADDFIGALCASLTAEGDAQGTPCPLCALPALCSCVQGLRTPVAIFWKRNARARRSSDADTAASHRHCQR